MEPLLWRMPHALYLLTHRSSLGPNNAVSPLPACSYATLVLTILPNNCVTRPVRARAADEDHRQRHAGADVLRAVEAHRREDVQEGGHPSLAVKRTREEAAVQAPCRSCCGHAAGVLRSGAGFGLAVVCSVYRDGVSRSDCVG
jgi:hypothetical protein